MNTNPIQLPVLAAPPATDREEPSMPNGTVETLPPLMTEVPAGVLMVGEKICRHPEDRSEVDWRVVARHIGEDRSVVVEYRFPDDPADAEPRTWTVTDPRDRGQWVTVEVSR
jgi:hypothetical protein